MFEQKHLRCGRSSCALIESLEPRRLMSAPVEGQPFNLRVTFNSHETRPMTAGDYSVEVHWGDGTKTVTRDVRQIKNYPSFEAFASKTYVDSGPLSGRRDIVVRNLKTGNVWTQGQIVGSVTDAPVAVDAHDFTVEETKPFSGIVATFASACAFDTADEFYARILWGDGTSSVGRVTGGGGTFAVAADHTFARTRPIPYVTDVFVKDEGGSNDGDKGKAFVTASKQTDQVRNVNQLNADLQRSTVLSDFAKQLGKTASQVLTAAADAVRAFSTGMLTDTKPPPLSLNDPGKYPFSRSLFDAGRLLRSIGAAPGDLYHLAAFVAKNPDVFSTQFAGKLVTAAQQWAGKTFNSPEAALGAVYAGFEAFAGMDAADFAGKTIGPAVAGRVLTRFGGAVIGKLTPAQRLGTAPLYADANFEAYLAGRGVVGLYRRAVPIEKLDWLIDAVRDVNFGNFSRNCVNCVREVERRLAGEFFQTAPKSGLQDWGALTGEFGGTVQKITNRTLLEAQLLRNAVNGEARGILALTKPGLQLIGNQYVWRPGHVINVVYKQGSGLWYIDAQSGWAYASTSPQIQAFLAPYSKTMEFLQTFGK